MQTFFRITSGKFTKLRSTLSTPQNHTVFNAGIQSYC